MENIKRVFVTGITGNQGSAVAKHLLNNKHEVYGLTRDAKSEKAQHWKNKGVKIVEGNLDDSATFQSAIKNFDAVYLVQTMQGKNSEIQQGKRFVDTVLSSGVKHLVYSSVLGADLESGIPHFDSKHEIEKHIKSSEINYTIIRPGSFYENHLHPQVAKGIKKGNYVTPLNKNCLLQMIGVDDIGKIAAQVILMPEKYANKTLSIATYENQIANIPQLFSRAVNQSMKYKKLPGFIVRLAMGKDLHKMFKYMNQNAFRIIDDIQIIRDEFCIDGDFQNWIDQNFTQKNP